MKQVGARHERRRIERQQKKERLGLRYRSSMLSRSRQEKVGKKTAMIKITKNSETTDSMMSCSDQCSSRNPTTVGIGTPMKTSSRDSIQTIPHMVVNRYVDLASRHGCRHWAIPDGCGITGRGRQRSRAGSP